MTHSRWWKRYLNYRNSFMWNRRFRKLNLRSGRFFFFECEMWRKCWSQKAVLNQQVNCDQVNLSAITCSLSYTWFPRAPVKRVNSMKKWPNRIGSFWAVRSVGHSLVLHTRALLLYRLTQSWPRVYYCFFSLWSPNDKEKTKNKQASA